MYKKRMAICDVSGMNFCGLLGQPIETILKVFDLSIICSTILSNIDILGKKSGNKTKTFLT